MSIFSDLIVLKDTELVILLEWVNHCWGLSLRLARYPANDVWMKGTQYFPEAVTERFGLTANVAIKAIQMFCAPMYYRSLGDEAQDAEMSCQMFSQKVVLSLTLLPVKLHCKPVCWRAHKRVSFKKCTWKRQTITDKRTEDVSLAWTLDTQTGSQQNRPICAYNVGR